MAKNYYLILGIAADASREEIQAAFRRRAWELHPDRSGLERGPFQDVQEAYSVLSEPERRRRYDREHPSSARRRPPAGPAPEPLVGARSRPEPFRPVAPASSFRELSLAESFETYRPSFEELFERFWSNFQDVSRPKSETLASLTLEVVLEAEEAARGGRVRVWIPARVICPACGGRGGVGPYECWRCAGHGVCATEHPIDLDYPAGLRDGWAARVPLTPYGIENLCLTVLFRVAQSGQGCDGVKPVPSRVECLRKTREGERGTRRGALFAARKPEHNPRGGANRRFDGSARSCRATTRSILRLRSRRSSCLPTPPAWHTRASDRLAWVKRSGRESS
jgi:DnaJ-class molecular chaperone